MGAKDPKRLPVDSKDSDQTAQADLSLRWAHMSEGTFSLVTTHHIYLSEIQLLCASPMHSLQSTEALSCFLSLDFWPKKQINQ